MAAGYPEGQHILFSVRGIHEDDVGWCIHGEGTYTDPIGSYPPGTYVLTVEMRYIDFFAQPQVLTIGTISFTVQGSAPSLMPVPATGSIAVIVLLVLIAGMAARSIRRALGAHLLLALLALAPLGAHADYAINGVKGGNGAPTPTQIVSWVKGSECLRCKRTRR